MLHILRILNHSHLFRLEDGGQEDGGGGGSPFIVGSRSINTAETDLIRIERYKDKYYLYNLSDEDIEYNITNNTCDNNSLVVVNVIEAGKQETISLPYDGSFILTASKVEEEVATSSNNKVYFSHYPFLTKQIVKGVKELLCKECRSCSDECDDTVKRECLVAQDTLNTMIILNSFLMPISSNKSTVREIDSFVKAAINNSKCRIYRDICNKSLITSITGNTHTNNNWTKYILAFYYLGFYFTEAKNAVDVDEAEHIKDKYQYYKLSKCISDLGMCLDTLEEIYENLPENDEDGEGDTEDNTAPEVDNVVKTILPDLSGEDPVYEYTFEIADFITNFTDAEGDNPNKVWITGLSEGATLYRNDVKVPNNNIILDYDEVTELKVVLNSDVNIDPNEFLLANPTLTLAQPENGSKRATIEGGPVKGGVRILAFKVSDDNTNPLFSRAKSITFNTVVTENLPPSCVESISIDITEGETITLTEAMFVGAFTDPEGDDIKQIKLTMPTARRNPITLRLNGVIISGEQVIDFNEVIDGNLTASCQNNIPGAPIVSSIDYSASDTGSGIFVNRCNSGETGTKSEVSKLKFKVKVSTNPLIVNAGEDQNLTANTTSVNLVGEVSGGSGTISTIIWSYTSVEQDAAVVIQNPSNLNTLVTGLKNGKQYKFKLTVIDDEGEKDTDEVIVNVASTTVITIEDTTLVKNYNSYDGLELLHALQLSEYIKNYTHANGLSPFFIKFVSTVDAGNLTAPNEGSNTYSPVVDGRVVRVKDLIENPLRFNIDGEGQTNSGDYTTSFTITVLDINEAESNEAVITIEAEDIDGLFDEFFDEEFE